MAIRNSIRATLLGLCIALPASGALAQQAQPTAAANADWQRTVASVLGKPGAEMADGVYRVALPRTDLKVTLDDVPIRAGFALGSWLAFEPHGQDLMVMGDLVLLKREVAPVMRALAAGGIEMTALHNHLLGAQPATMYLHVGGHGDATQLATTLRAGLQASATPLAAAAAAPAGDQGVEGVDTAAFARALGREGRAAGGVYGVTVARAAPVKDAGMEVPTAMGSATAINLQAAGNGKGAITGDFVLTANEVIPVQRALLENGIAVTAIHNHMLNDEPRIFFMHFWVVNDPEALGRGLRAAPDRTNSRQASR